MQKNTLALTYNIHSDKRIIINTFTIQYLLIQVKLLAISEYRCIIANIIHGSDLHRLLYGIDIVMIKCLFDLEAELQSTYDLLLELIKMRLLLATTLNLNNLQSLGNLYTAISAQTIKSKTHCEVSASPSMPVVLKNKTNDNLLATNNAVMIVYRFMGGNHSGQVYLLHTHDNLNKDYHRQSEKTGNYPILGSIIKCHIFAGNQFLELLYEKMRYRITGIYIYRKSNDSLIHQLDGTRQSGEVSVW